MSRVVGTSHEDMKAPLCMERSGLSRRFCFSRKAILGVTAAAGGVEGVTLGRYDRFAYSPKPLKSSWTQASSPATSAS